MESYWAVHPYGTVYNVVQDLTFRLGDKTLMEAGKQYLFFGVVRFSGSNF